MNRTMTKKTFNIVAFHVVCWILVASPAIIFSPQHMRNSGVMCLLRLCLPLFLSAIFYINYLWLVPEYLVNGRRNVYVCINILCILLFAFCTDRLMDISRMLELAAGWNPPPPHDPMPEGMAMLLSFVRNVFPFLLSVTLATSVRLALRWQTAESERKEMEIQKTEAELSNLRNQINPHFLLNTLNNIYALISFDKDKAQKAVLSLSSLLRQMLYGARNNSVSLKEETEFIGNYVELMKIRLNKNVKIDFNVSIKTDKELRIAPLIIISLVENAFKHGVGTTRPSFISINIIADENKIECGIRNSNFPKNDSDKSGHGIGLEQVAKRLDMAYAGKYVWERGTDDKNEVYYSKIVLYDTQMKVISKKRLTPLIKKGIFTSTHPENFIFNNPEEFQSLTNQISFKKDPKQAALLEKFDNAAQ